MRRDRLQRMTHAPRIAFIGAGSTVFMKNIVGDMLQRPACRGATIALMDIDPKRLAESELVAGKIIATLGVKAKVETYTDQRRALEGADFVIVAFQIGGYEPCTVTDFEVPKKYRPAPDHRRHAGRGRHHARACAPCRISGRSAEDMAAVCPKALMLQYVNPMAINTWAHRGEVSARSGRWACAIRCRARRRNWRATSTFRWTTSATAPPASTTWPST